MSASATQGGHKYVVCHALLTLEQHYAWQCYLSILQTFAILCSNNVPSEQSDEIIPGIISKRVPVVSLYY